MVAAGATAREEDDIVDAYLRALEAGDQEAARALRPLFICICGSFSARRGISYAAWRDAGVSHADLLAAGLR